MTRRLLVVDRYDAPALREAAASGEPHDVLLLGLSAEWFRWQHAAVASALAGCRLVDSTPLVAAATARVREFVVRTIAELPSRDLGGETLESLLRDPEGNIWWHLETSEKGPYRGPLIQQLFLVALAREAAVAGGYESVTFSVRDAAVAAVFRTDPGWSEVANGAAGLSRPHPFRRYWMHALAAAVNLLAARAFSPAVPDTRPGGTWIFTAYPAWWNRPEAPDTTERFFGDAGDRVVDGYLVLVTTPAPLTRGGAPLRARLRAKRMVMLPRFFRARDLGAVLSPRRFARLVRFERGLRAHVRAPFAGFDAGSLIAGDLTRALSGGEPFQDLLLRRSVSRAVAHVRPAMVLYRAEFQPAENAMLSGAQPATRAVGFVHFPFGENYLPMRFAQGEIAGWLRRDGSPDARPLPAALIANGPRIADHATATGYPRERVALCGPVRYASLVEARAAARDRAALRARLGLPLEASVVFVALAIVEADTQALFGALVESRSPGAVFVIRTHPNRPHGDAALQQTLAALGDRARLVPPGAPIYDLMAASDAMVCIGSMIAFEAMALGVMPIVFENPSTYCAVSLAEYDEGLFIARTAGELSAALRSVLRHDEADRRKRTAWPALLSGVMGDLDRDPASQLRDALDRLSPA